MIRVDCPCQARFMAKDEWAGKTVKCPECGAPLRIAGSPKVSPTPGPLAFPSGKQFPPHESQSIPPRHASIATAAPTPTTASSPEATLAEGESFTCAPSKLRPMIGGMALMLIFPFGIAALWVAMACIVWPLAWLTYWKIFGQHDIVSPRILLAAFPAGVCLTAFGTRMAWKGIPPEFASKLNPAFAAVWYYQLIAILVMGISCVVSIGWNYARYVAAGYGALNIAVDFFGARCILPYTALLQFPNWFFYGRVAKVFRLPQAALAPFIGALAVGSVAVFSVGTGLLGMRFQGFVVQFPMISGIVGISISFLLNLILAIATTLRVRRLANSG